MRLVLAHADRVPIEGLGTAWQAPPAVLAAAAVALALFAQAFVRLRRRGRADLASPGRAALALLAVAVALLALLSPLDAAGEEYLLSAHMLQHVALADLAPALAVVAVRGALAVFLLPPALLAPLARSRRLRAVLRALLRPRVALAVWAAVLAGWHVPAAYQAALAHQAVHDLEHATFALAGLLVWLVLVDPARRGELSVGRRIAFAAMVFAGGQVLADVLIFSFEPLHGAYAAQDERLLGLSPLLDQKLAGVVMMGEQLLTLGTCVAFLALERRRATLRPRASALEA